MRPHVRLPLPRPPTTPFQPPIGLRPTTVLPFQAFCHFADMVSVTAGANHRASGGTMRHFSVSRRHRLTIFCTKKVRRPSRKLSGTYLMTLKPLQTPSDTGNVNSAWADNVEVPPAATCTVHPFSFAGVHPLVIKPPLASTVALIIYPPPQNPSLALFSPDLLYAFFYLSVLSSTRSFPSQLLSYHGHRSYQEQESPPGRSCDD